MTVVQELEKLETRVLARLSELEPLVAEYQHLKEAAARMGLHTSTPRPTARRGAGASNRPGKNRRSGTAGQPAQGGRRGRPPSAQRDQAVVETIHRSPGMTVAELAKELDIDPTGLYRVIRRLEADGVVRKDGRQLQPA